MTDTLSPLDLQTAPAPGTYQIDQSHSMVEFTARHLMVTKVRGRFAEFSGTIQVGETAEQSAVNVVIEAASIESGDQKRDEHLRGADFLDVENYPTLEFHTTKIEQRGDK